MNIISIYRQNVNRHLTLHFALIVIVVCVLFTRFASQAQAVADICVPTQDSVTGVPTIDGKVEGDIGWTKSTVLNLGVDTGTENSVVVRMVKDKNDDYVYLSFSVTSTWNEDDRIVLVFSPDGQADHDYRIHIKPFGPGGALNPNVSIPTAPYEIVAWRNSTTWNDNTGGWTETNPGNGDWLYTNTSVTIFTSPQGWSIETKIPRITSGPTTTLADGIWFEATTFKMYINVLRTNWGSATAVQAPWPQGVYFTQNSYVEAGTPSLFASGAPTCTSGAPSCTAATPSCSSGNPACASGVPVCDAGVPKCQQWADASLTARSTCSGVSLQGLNIGTTNPVSSQMKLYTKPTGSPLTAADCPPPVGSENLISTVSNTFIAKPENSMSGQANNVRVTYKLANWGMPPTDSEHPPWMNVPATAPSTNPTPTNNIPVTTGTPAEHLFDMAWAPTYKQSCDYLSHKHQCMVATMTSPDPNTRFLNNSTRRNMDFVTASRFERDATISAKGYGAPPSGNAQQEFLISVGTAMSRKGDPGERREPTESMKWIARGYRKTGNFIIINGRKYNVVDEIGGFGYVAEHKGQTDEWREKLEGSGLDEIAKNLFKIQIPQDGEAIVRTTIDALEFKRFSLGIFGGISFPHGAFGNSLDLGPELGLVFEYRYTPVDSVELQYAKHMFDGVGSTQDTDVTQYSGNARRYFVFDSLRFFANIGAGSYAFSPGSTNSGINLGGGLQYLLSTDWAVEGAYNYHKVSNSVLSDPAFSTVQVGVRYRF